MRLSPYLAGKYIVNDKRRTIFLVLIISTILMMTIGTTIIMENGLSGQRIDAQINHGKWHMAFILEDESSIDEIRANGNTKNASIIKRTVPLSMGEESFQIFLAEQQHMDIMFYNLSDGQIPTKEREILVPEWYLRRQNIEKLPAIISKEGIDFIITGAYRAKADSISYENIRAYGSLEANPGFTDEFLTTSPYDSIINRDKNKTFVFIQLNKDADLELALSQYLEIRGVKVFDIGLDGVDEKPLYNYSLLAAEKRTDFKDRDNISYNKSNFLIDKFPLILNIILLAILFITIFVAMNLIITNNVRLFGMFAALGIPPRRIRNIILFQSMFLAILAIPVGTFLGIISSYTFLQLTIGKMYGSVQIPLLKIILSIFFCLISVIISSMYPAVRAGSISPVEAMSTIQGLNQEGEDIDIFPLERTRSRFSFAILFGIKNILRNKNRIISFIIIISALLALFIKLSSIIETSWKSGDWRRSYDSDYEIEMDMGNDHQMPIDMNFIEEIEEMDGIKNIYYQYSIFDLDIMGSENNYSYFFQLPKDILTAQAYKQLDLSAPITRDDYDDEIFVMAGISGYTDKELNDLAHRYLIQGQIDIEGMKREPIILLPKYIQWLENMDIPYTSLEVGDTISMVEDSSDSLIDIDIRKRYDFKIGGFLSNLPLEQVNGVNNGFVAIMHEEQFNYLETEYKGIKGVYIDVEDSANIGDKLNKMAKSEGYSFVNNRDSFERGERQSQEVMMIYTFYSISIVLGTVIFLAIFNLILSNIIMRQREFTMLYAIGILKWQRTLSIIIEILAFTFPGIILGVGTGVYLIMTGDLRSEILTTSQLIPWVHIVSASAIVVLAVLLTIMVGISYINKNCNIQNIYNE